MNILALSIIISLLLGALIAVISFMVIRNIQAKDPEARYAEQLEMILRGGTEEDYALEAHTPGVIEKWNRYWGRLFKEISPNYSPETNNAGLTVVVIWGAILVAVSVFFKSPLAGVLIATAVVIGISVTLSIKSRQKDSIIRNQLTGFLFALKANVSANLTPERAMSKIIPNMPSPLYEELEPIRKQLSANVSFKDTLIDLKDRTTSDDLKFLCSCIIMATTDGVSLEQQIDIIRETVDQKKRISEEISQATKAATMNTYAASIIIPIGFLGTYLIDERSREFWFVEPISWAALAAVFVLYGIGVFLSRKFVSKVRKL